MSSILALLMMMMVVIVLLPLPLPLPSSSDKEFVFVDGLLQHHHHHHCRHRRHRSRHRPTRSRRSDAFEHPMAQQHDRERNEVQSTTSSQPQPLERRRSFLSKMIVFSTVTATITTTFTVGGGDKADAAMMTIPLSLLSFPGSQSSSQQQQQQQQQDNNRRQLELCLVNLLRLKYWSIGIIDRLNHQQQQQQQDQTTTTTSAATDTTTQSNAKTSAVRDDDDAVVKAAYLEARLGAKVIVAPKKKIGGGAGLSILTLKSLQIKDCLDDVRYYADRGGVELSLSSSSSSVSKQQRKELLIEQSEDLIEALASIVEFDGLETTQDDSPRSSLTLGMYNRQKGMYVRRMLSERVVPLVDSIIGTFGTDKLREADGYVNDYYVKEIPPSVSNRDTETTTLL